MTLPIPQEAFDTLMEIEAEACAKKVGISLELARATAKELWDDGELELRQVGKGKFILAVKGGKATWLRPVK